MTEELLVSPLVVRLAGSSREGPPRRWTALLPAGARKRRTSMGQRFAYFANRASTLAGHYITFLAALALIIGWAITGPLFGFSETWQLIINTSTTVLTFLMVFLIQNTQNRDARAVHLKLDEIIRSIEAADNAIIRAEDETDEELADLKRRYEALIDEHEVLKARLAPPPVNGKVDLRGASSAV
jgi:low affinity Fe/Cu permease